MHFIIIIINDWLSDYNLNLICEDKCYTELIDCAQKCNGESTCLGNCARDEAHCIQGLKKKETDGQISSGQLSN